MAEFKQRHRRRNHSLSGAMVLSLPLVQSPSIIVTAVCTGDNGTIAMEAQAV